MKSHLVALAALLSTMAPCACKLRGASAAPDAGSPAALASSPPVPSAAASLSPASASPAASDPKSPLALPGATVAAFPNMSFPERFALEAKGRPPGIKPTSTDVLTALRTAGVDVVDVKQHLASPQGARYCVGGHVLGADKETRVDLSVCECANPEVARVARDYSLESLKTVVPNRTLYVNRATMLIVREAQKTADNDALVATIASTFAKL